MALSLVDLSLAGNLVVIVTLSGYENFVAKIMPADAAARPDWMRMVDFSDLKIKVIASVVTISVVALLRAFMALLEPGSTLDPGKLMWLVGIVLTFVVSGVLFATMDLLSARAEGRRHEAGS
jgi:uncharacterized protein (TIGR00645 family)